MKISKILSMLFFAFVLSVTACGDAADESTAIDPGTVLYTTLPDVIGGNTLGGYLADIDSEPFLEYSNYADGGAVITSPAAAHIQVDGFVKVEGSKSGSNPIYLGIVKGSSIVYMELLATGSFSRYLYFREAAADYAIVLMQPARASYSFLCRIDVTNEPSADIQFLVPSTRVQAFDAEIRLLAKQIIDALDNPSDEDIAKAFHDYIIKSIYYDLDSLVPEQRKDQDALAVITNGMAVCEGYATLYTALLRACGIPALVMTGDTDGGSHAWSRVYWDSAWHNVDVTWDDPLMDDGSGNCGSLPDWGGCSSDFPDGDNLRYKYFDISQVDIEDDHYNGLIETYYK